MGTIDSDLTSNRSSHLVPDADDALVIRQNVVIVASRLVRGRQA